MQNPLSNHALAQEHPRSKEIAPLTVTVVIPCYRQAHYLKECLLSIRAQKFEGWEAVVVDDASPDGEDIREVVEGLADPRIRLVRHDRNKGLAASRNTGFRESRTEVVLPLDADDKLTSDCLESLVEILERDPNLDCAFGDVQLFGRRDTLVSFAGPPPGEKLLHGGDTIPGAGAAMRRRLWEKLGGYDENEILRHGREDFEFWIRAFDSGLRFQRVPKATYLYRVTHSSMRVTCELRDHDVARYIYSKHQRLFDESGEGRRFLSLWHTRAAQASYERGMPARAVRLAWQSWRFLPDRHGVKLMLRTLIPPSVNRRFSARGIHRLVPILNYPLRGQKRYSPFFVIGVARSGNTLLRRILTAHSQLHIPPETFVLGECIREFRRYGKHLNWRDLVSLILAKFQFHPEFETFDLNLAPLANQLASVPRRDRNLAHILNAFYCLHAQKSGKVSARWGDKTPFNSLDDHLMRGEQPPRLGAGVPETLERLLEVFPDAQFIHIYRDGCDVVCSHLQGGFYSDIEDAAKRWLHVERQTRRFARKYADRSFDVRYEDLVRQPENVVRGLCAFLGVSFEPQMLSSEGAAHRLGDVPAWFWHKQVAQPINRDNPGKGRRYFTPDEREQLQDWIGAELAELGYSPATDDGAGRHG